MSANNPIANAPAETARLAPPQRRSIRGFSLLELLIYMALASVFIGGILTLYRQADVEAEVRQTVQDINDINNALSGYYGAQRIATTSAPTSVRMEGVVADKIDSLAGPTTGEIITQFGTEIHLTTANAVSTTNYYWPNYWITYTGLRTETCGTLLGALTGPVAVMIQSATTAPTSFAVAEDHRVEALTSATSLEAFCDTEAGTAETYSVVAVYRI